MGQPVIAGEGEEGSELLLAEADGDREGEPTWRFNFDGFRRAEECKEKAPRGLQDCLGVLGPGDVVAEYYQLQIEMLEGFNEMDTLTGRGVLPGMSKEEREKTARSETLAVRITNIANMVLFAAKVYASIRSGSLAIVASTLDSLLDLLSGFILWFTVFSMQTPNPYQYPIGKKRMQPLDHFFDVITNIIGLVAALLANYLKYWIDPVGAIVLALYTIHTWSSNRPWVDQQLQSICRSAHIYAGTTTKAIRHIDMVRAYTFGLHYFVEVDIVLPSEMPLEKFMIYERHCKRSSNHCLRLNEHLCILIMSSLIGPSMHRLKIDDISS